MKMSKSRFLQWCTEEMVRMGQRRAEGALGNIEAMTKSGLIEVAKAAKVKGYSRMNIDQLREAISAKVRDEASPATVDEFVEAVLAKPPKVELPSGWNPRKTLRALKVETKLVNRINGVAYDDKGKPYATSRSHVRVPA